MWASSRPPIVSSYHHGIFCKFERISQRCSSAMVEAMQQQQQRGACMAGVGVGGILDVVASSRVRMQTVVKSGKRSEPFDQLKLKLACREASILRSQETMNYDRLCVVSVVASQALQDKAALLFARICVNPKVLSPEAAEFMLTVSASHTTLSQAESESASQVDLILRGVHPTSFQPVLLVCTTTMFATPVAQSDVEKAKRRGELWRRAVGAAFLVVPVVAGYAISIERSRNLVEHIVMFAGGAINLKRLLEGQESCCAHRRVRRGYKKYTRMYKAPAPLPNNRLLVEEQEPCTSSCS